MSIQQSLSPNDTRRPWVVSLCGCRNYRDSQGNSRFCCDYCCASMFCSSYILGKIHTKLHREKECCYGMGCRGTACCIITTPLALASFGNAYMGLAGMAGFCCLSNWYRRDIIKEYHVKEEEVLLCCFCGPPLTPWCDFIHIGCNYPCSFFQMYMSLEEWQQQSLYSATNQAIAIPVASPIY
eukprot:gene15091-20308_t